MRSYSLAESTLEVFEKGPRCLDVATRGDPSVRWFGSTDDALSFNARLAGTSRVRTRRLGQYKTEIDEARLKSLRIDSASKL